MKLREKFRRFWTMDVHNHEGFTLVELIIVIAILAILSSVAVVGYSSYVEKANKQADLTLAAEIEQALTLAMYSDMLTDGDYVVIQFGANAMFGNANDTNVRTADAAMKAAFGDNWQTSLKLVYGDWSKPLIADGVMMGYVDKSAFNSSNMKELLVKVQDISDEFCDYIEGGTFTPSNELKSYLEAMGIDYTKDPQAASNAAVLFVGNTFTDLEISDEAYYDAWVTANFDSITDAVTSAAAEYASVLALAQYVDSKVEGATYEATLTAATGPAIVGATATVQSSITSEHPELFAEYYGMSVVDDEVVFDTTSLGYADAMAFKAYMDGMTSAKDDLVQNTNMSSSEYFTDGAVLNYVTNFVEIGKLLGDAEAAFVFYYRNGALFRFAGE